MLKRMILAVLLVAACSSGKPDGWAGQVLGHSAPSGWAGEYLGGAAQP